LKKILILDDENAIRQSFIDYFEDNLWYPIASNSAEDALEVLNDEQPVAAIVDVRLPGMNGADFVRSLNKAGHLIACVFCTGSPEFHIPTDLACLPMVSNNLFKKPVTHLKELEEEVEQTITLITKD